MSASTTGGKVPARCSRFLCRSMSTTFGQFAQHVLERGTVGILGAEGAGDLAGADIAGALADEGEKLLARGE